MVSVSDTGVGLPPQQANQIFDAFFTTTSRRFIRSFVAIPIIKKGVT
jgi:signal transduction histidine kinase